MLISLTCGSQWPSLELLTAHKITTFRCKYLATMATGDNDDGDEDGATMMMTTTRSRARQAMGYNEDGVG